MVLNKPSILSICAQNSLLKPKEGNAKCPSTRHKHASSSALLWRIPAPLSIHLHLMWKSPVTRPDRLEEDVSSRRHANQSTWHNPQRGFDRRPVDTPQPAPRLFQAPLLLTSAAEMKRNHNWVHEAKREKFFYRPTNVTTPNALYIQTENMALLKKKALYLLSKNFWFVI